MTIFSLSNWLIQAQPKDLLWNRTGPGVVSLILLSQRCLKVIVLRKLHSEDFVHKNTVRKDPSSKTSFSILGKKFITLVPIFAFRPRKKYFFFRYGCLGPSMLIYHSEVSKKAYLRQIPQSGVSHIDFNSTT